MGLLELDDVTGAAAIELNLQKPYHSAEEFFEAIKGIPFKAGEPELYADGIIAFPEINLHNQVWIMGIGDGKFQVMRTTQPLTPFATEKSEILSKLTLGLSDYSAAFGKKKKRCIELVKITAKQIEEAGV